MTNRRGGGIDMPDDARELAWALWWLFAFAPPRLAPPDVQRAAMREFERQFGRAGYVRYVEGHEWAIEREGEACYRRVAHKKQL